MIKNNITKVTQGRRTDAADATNENNDLMGFADFFYIYIYHINMVKNFR